MVHLGTALAVILWFRQELVEIISAFGKSIPKLNQWNTFVAHLKNNYYCRFAWLLLASTYPAILGYLFQDKIEQAFNNISLIAVMLAITGIGLFWRIDILLKVTKIAELSLTDALLIGLAQAFAIIPSISRSGSIIIMALGRIRAKTCCHIFFYFVGTIIIGASSVNTKRYHSSK